MKRLLVLVEGSTEDRFVKDVLRPHLEPRGLTPISTIISTKRMKSGPDFKGGLLNFSKLDDHVRRLMRDTNAVLITTVIDFYGFPDDFAGWATVTSTQPRERVRQLEAAIASHFGHPRFRPYLSLPEYEAMVFSHPDTAAEVLSVPDLRPHLRAVRAAFKDPEEIDEGKATAPSKRLLELIPGYRKRLHGPLIVGKIGLATVRAECPHFNEWLSELEALGTVVA